jgi:hypothetical protein
VEVGAFERAYPLPTVRLRALRWPVETRLAATAYARQRLDDLAVLVASEHRERREHETGSHGASVWPVAVPILAVVVALVVIGAVTAVQWIF